MPEPDPILIVGAGPTGLALACELYRRRVPCRVVEATAERGRRSKAVAIWPRVLEILAGLGAADAAISRGIRLDGSTVWSNGLPALSLRLADLSTHFPFALALPQYETEAILETRLGELGGKVEHGTRCTGLVADDHGVTVRLRHTVDEETRVAWVVGCDGTAGVVRAAADIPLRQRLEPEGWIAADVRLVTELSPTGVNYFLSAGRVLHVVPLRRDDGLVWRITLNIGPRQPEPADWPVERLAAAAAERAAVRVEVTDVEWVTGFRIRQGLAVRFRSGRVLLAGDTAHAHSPAGAQGINAGLQDAANLGWKLARVASGSSGPSLLATYNAERRPAARATVRATDHTTRLGTLRAPAAVAARDVLWRVATRGGVVDRRIAPAAAGLGQRLSRSSASPRPSFAPPTSHGAGTLLPDVRLAGHGPGEAWLSDIVSGGGFTVLLVGLGQADCGSALVGRLPANVAVVQVISCAQAGTAPPSVRAVADPDERVARALRVRAATLFVVRPDRHIAIRRPARPLATAIGHAVRYFDDIGEGGSCRAPET